MKAKRFGAVFPLFLIIATLTASFMTLLSVSQVSAQGTGYIIVQGRDSCFSADKYGPVPAKVYGMGEMPPVMAAKRIGAGAVIAAGIGRTCNGGTGPPGRGYADRRWTVGELDVLLDEAFQWMRPGATKVLWFGTYKQTYRDYDVYNDAYRCSWLIDNLKAKGYTVDGLIDGPITSTLLAPYDILVIPQIQLGDMSIGGEPDLLPDADVEAIVKFVEENGKGLFIMEGEDSTHYNFHEVQNKILKALNFGLYFQNDSIRDDADTEPYITADVTENHFGNDYRTATSKTTVRLYRVNTLLLPMPGAIVEIVPPHRSSLPGSTLNFSVSVMNPDETEDSYRLTASDTKGWPLTLSESYLIGVPPGEKRGTTLTVTISSGAAIGAEDVITVKADSTVKAGVSGSKNFTVQAEMQLTPPTDDTYTHEARPNMNFGAATSMFVGWYLGGPERVWLKFDLSVLPAGTSIGKVKLWLFCDTVTGWGSRGVKCHSVDNDDWTEKTITWNNQPPTIGGLLDGPKPVEITGWYSWDVTSFVQQEFAGDKKVSFYLLDNEEHIEDDHSPWFVTEEGDVRLWPYLEFVPAYKMDMSILPPWTQDNSPGGTLTYTIVVNNLGMNEDTYGLTASSARGWGVAIAPTSLTVPPDESRTAKLTVTIPSGAPLSTKDTITVTATGTGVSKSATCKAHAFEGARLLPIADAYVAEGYEHTKYGGENTLYLRSGATGDKDQRIFLKFDLSAIPPGSTILDAELWLWSRVAELADINAQCWKVTDDAFIDEAIITWGTSWDLPRDVLDTAALRYLPPSEDTWISWSVTSFVQSEFAGDKKASFCIMAETEGTSGRYTFNSREWPRENERPRLKVTYTAVPPAWGVDVSISPSYLSDQPGESLNYTVTVKNLGLTTDNYTLTKSDNAGWSISISPTSLTVPAGENRTATLSVTVPENAENCTRDEVTVTATSTENAAVTNSASCIAHAVVGIAPPPPGRGVQVTISPESQPGAPGGVLDFSVTVKNTGIDEDTFSLQATDTKGWGPTLSITSTPLPGGAQRIGIKLSVKIPDNASEGDSTTITVRAAGTGYENSDTCTATAVAGGISSLVYIGAAVVIVVIIAAVLIIKPF